jgi:hypothetical protein
VSAHNVLADGYCQTCQRIPCGQGKQSRAPTTGQLDRIEAKLNRICRALKITEDE